MPDVEKVVKVLEEVIAEAVYPDRPRKFMMPLELAEDAIALLKEQEPVKPVMVNGEPECGACRYELRTDADSYCPCCGRKVKWE